MRSFTTFAAAAVAAVLAVPATAAPDHGEPAPRFVHRRAASAGSSASAGMVLTGPSPGDKFNEGATCLVTWNPDTSGADTWKSFTLDLMTGSNLAMQKLKTVATKLDGTPSGPGKYEWTCPEVQPNSAIYFYQATTDGTTNPQWTTRFAIADQSGNTTPPKHANQPQPATPAIPWGKGSLVAASGAGSGAGAASASGASGAGSSSSSSTESSGSAEQSSAAPTDSTSAAPALTSSSSSSSQAQQTSSSSEAEPSPSSSSARSSSQQGVSTSTASSAADTISSAAAVSAQASTVAASSESKSPASHTCPAATLAMVAGIVAVVVAL